MIYYFSFGQQHRHPTTNESMKDYWIEVDADDELIARAVMLNKFGIKWSHQYDKKDFEPSYFPNGCYERLVQDEDVSPQQYIKVCNGSIINENEKWDPKWDPKLCHLMDKQFMEGFKAAYDLIDNIFCCYKEPPFDELWEEIEEEFENYKKDS